MSIAGFTVRHVAASYRQIDTTRWVASCSCGQKFYGPARQKAEGRRDQHMAR